MIHAITGMTGSGKSFHAMRILLEQLRQGRNVVTNLPIHLDRLNEFLQDYPEVNVLDQLTILTDPDQISFFWCIRGTGPDDRRGPPSTWAIDPRDPSKVILPPKVWPVSFIIDEMHLIYNARAWAKTGKSTLWWASQNRKFGDELFWISQHPGNVDVQFRKLTVDWTHCRNMALERWGWIFTPPPKFIAETRWDEGSRAVSSDIHYYTIKNPKGLCDCYDTLSGNGIPGLSQTTKTTKRRRGIPVVFAIPMAVVAIIVAGIAIPKMAMMGTHAGASFLKIDTNPDGKTPITAPAPAAAPAPVAGVGPSSAQPPADPSKEHLGFYTIDGRLYMLTDEGPKIAHSLLPGRQIRGFDGQIYTLRKQQPLVSQ